MQSVDLLNDNPHPTEDEVRVGLEGNLCRCTGYHNIVRSVLHAADQGSRPARRPEGRSHDRHRGRSRQAEIGHDRAARRTSG